MQGSNTTDVSGQVVRWSHENGVAKLEAATYIEMLEREVEILRQELDDSNEVCNTPSLWILLYNLSGQSSCHTSHALLVCVRPRSCQRRP